MDSTLQSVVVAVRVRPLGDANKENAYSVVHHLPDEANILSVADKGFAFDHVFAEDTGQAEVYEEAVKPVVEKLFKGYNCAVIAYGHTGTGKTYTMGTDPKKCEGRCAGIIIRAVEEVINQHPDDTVEISFMEIYNEEVYDLLTSQLRKLIVHGFNVQSLSRVKVTTVEEAIHHLEVGSSNRHTRSTKLNAQSSRSHAIFSIYYQKKMGGEQFVVSKLDLVDLAGSESVRHTGNKGEALIEGNKINCGLLNLRNVISILSMNPKDYVPYRRSMLTTVLKDSLSRESFVTMIACISPSNLDVPHTVMTLRFVEEAKKMLNKPKINQIVQKFKVANPQMFEAFAGLTPLIPPTPTTKNLYKFNSTPVASNLRKPVMQLNLTSPFSSSTDFQDSMFKPQMNTIMETPRNSSFSSSHMSTSSKLDLPEVASVLSPLLRKHMKQFQEQLQETLNSTILMAQQRPRAPVGGEQNYTGSPIHEHNSNIRTVLSVAESTERTFRNELKNMKAELKSYVQKKFESIDHLDVSSREGAILKVPQKKVSRNLSYTNKEKNSHKQKHNKSPMSGEESVPMPEKRLTRSSSSFIGRIGYSSTPEDLSPINMSTMTTVKRRRCVTKEHDTNMSIICNNTGKDCAFRTSTVRRSARLSLRTRINYKDQHPSPSLHTKWIRKMSMKPVYAASPSNKSPKTVQDKFKKKVLQMLNGSLKDLTQLVTIGPKTALIIYNYRLLNNYKFKKFEDLKNVPGLPSSYYERFIKANNVF